jgi:hypothetical protein
MTMKAGFDSGELPPGGHLHHLTFDSSRGKWEVRLTIVCGPKIVGKKVRIKLGVCDEETAISKRDTILKAYAKAGLIVKMRKQRRSD